MANPENAAKAYKRKVKLIIIIAASVLLMAAWIVVFYSMYWNNWTVQSAASEGLLDKAGGYLEDVTSWEGRKPIDVLPISM